MGLARGGGGAGACWTGPGSVLVIGCLLWRRGGGGWDACIWWAGRFLIPGLDSFSLLLRGGLWSTDEWAVGQWPGEFFCVCALVGLPWFAAPDLLPLALLLLALLHAFDCVSYGFRL